MNNIIKKAAVVIADWKAEARGYRQGAAELKAAIPAKERQVSALALAIKQGNADAIEEAAKLKAEIAADREEIALSEEAARQLDALATDELQAEQLRADKHLRRKIGQKLQTLPAIAKDVERHTKGLAESLAALRDATDPLGIAWRDTWPQKPSILYPKTVNRIIGHALYVLLRQHHVALPELKYTESDFPGLQKYFAVAATKARNALFSEDPTTAIDDLPADEPVTKPEAPAAPELHYVTDTEIAARNADGTAQDMPGWALSGREYVKQRDYGTAKRPVILPEIDPFTGAPIDGSDI